MDSKMENENLRVFCDRWLNKTQQYDLTNLSNSFDKFFSLFVVYNSLYVEATHALKKRDENKGKLNTYKNVESSIAASDHVVKYIGARDLNNSLRECDTEINRLINIFERGYFFIKLDKKTGQPVPEKDRKLLDSLKGTHTDKKYKAILEIIYFVRCNMFHGRKEFHPIQEELLIPLMVILEKVILKLYQKIFGVKYKYNPVIHIPDEIAHQIEANIQKNGETFEQFIQKAVVHELERRKTEQAKQNNDLKRIHAFIDKHESVLLKLAQ